MLKAPAMPAGAHGRDGAKRGGGDRAADGGSRRLRRLLAPPENNSAAGQRAGSNHLLDDDGRGDGAENNPEANGGDADGFLQIGQGGSRVECIQKWGRS